MRITFLLTSSIDMAAGLRYFPLAKELVALGHQVVILALHPDISSCSQRKTELSGVKVQYVGQMHIRRYQGEVERFGPAELLRVLCRSTSAMTYHAMWSDTDVLHLGKPQPINGVAALLGGRFWRKAPLYLDCDDYEAQANVFAAEWQSKVFAFFEDLMPRFARGITVNTPYLRDRNVALGFPRDRIVYVPNGVDRDDIAAIQEEAVERLRRELGLGEAGVVAYVGHMGLVNHPVDLLLEAFAHVNREYRQARLLLVGGGEDLGLLRAQASALGLAHKVIFVGHVSHDLALRYLKMADISVDPVHDDPVARARSPLKIFESMAVGTPVVTGDVGDRRNILGNGKAGLLVNPGDSQALAEGILELLRDEDRLRTAVDMALEVREKYYWDVLVREFVRVYNVRQE